MVIINFSGPPESIQKYTINEIFHLKDTLDNISLSKNEIQFIVLPDTAKLTLQSLQKL